MDNLEKYRTIFNNSNDAIYFIRVKEDGSYGRFYDVNDVACEMLGYSREEFLKMTPGEIDAFDASKRVPGLMDQLLHKKKIRFEMKHTGKNGETVPVEVNARLIEDAEGQKIVAIARDISERKAREQNLRLYREIISSVNDPMAVVDKEYCYKLVNVAYSDFYQTSRDRIVGKRVDHFFKPALFDNVIKPNLDRCFSGQTVGYEAWVEFPGGEEKFMAMQYYPHYSTEGEVIGCISHGRDLTKEKRLELQLEEGRTLFRSIVNTMPGTLNVMDTGYNLQALNNNRIKMDLMEGDSPEDLIGQKCYRVFQKRETPCPWCKIDRVIKSGERIVETTTPDDPREILTGRALKIFLYPMKDENGKTIGAIEYGLDVTELREAKNKAEKLAGEKSLLLANMSHEIKNQLNGIISLSKVLKNIDLDSEKVDFVNTIVRSGRDLLKIVDDSLLLSRMESGKLEIGMVDTRISHLVKQTVEIVNPSVNEKDNRLTYEIDDDIPQMVRADPLRISQVLINLLTNANKFTDAGNIVLKVEKRGEDEKTLRLRFSVSDTGIGIQQEKQERIFKAFEKGGSNASGPIEGSGLGLFISNNILQLMDSRLELRSSPGAGSEFSFELEVEKIEEQKETTESGAKALNSVLIADDDEVSLMLAEMLIKETFPDVTIYKATDGKMTLSLYEKHKPDAILMDVQMPVMNGLEVTKRIREKKSGKDQPRIIGYSAAVFRDDIQTAIDTGMDEYIKKPFLKKELIQAFKKAVARDQ